MQAVRTTFTSAPSSDRPSPHWRRWLGPAHRCLVPMDCFAEPRPGKGAGNTWFRLAGDRPGFAIAPVLAGMTRLAVDMGWSEAEVHVAVLSLALGELRALTGPAAAAAVLDQARALIVSMERV